MKAKMRFSLKAGERIFLRFALELQTLLAQQIDQARLLVVRLLELVRARRNLRLQTLAILLQLLERARVSRRRRDLLRELLHQMQIGGRIHVGLGVLHAQQPGHDAPFDERYDQQRTGLLAGRLRTLAQRNRGQKS